ncbi:transposase family protein [Actinomyces israelii]
MIKGITGLDRVQISRLVEPVLGDSEIALAPRVLSPLAAVRATLMYLRTNASQAGIADIMGVSQPTISRTISVITRIIAGALGPPPATAEEIPHAGAYIIDGTLLPCWSWKDQPDLWSGRHRRTGMSLQVLVSLTGHLRWASDPPPGATRDSKAITTSGVLEQIAPSCCIADKGHIGTGVVTPVRNLLTASPPRPRDRRARPWAESATSWREPSRTSRPGRSWPTTTDDPCIPSNKPSQPH